MASFAAACRFTARAAAQQVRDNGARRAFRTAAASRAAQNFTMPALSPTMTEGNIATWRVKEGESFSAGDVLLEIETDKAQMDVEAQDDGVLAKIIQGDGAKAIQVGTRIAVTAEPGDDLSTLEIPPENDAATKPTADGKATPNEAPKETEPVPKQERKIPSQAEEASPPAAKKMASGEAKKQTYPLYPSVQHLLKENGLPREEADKIPATGPNGRLLKGDVLAYLGRINESYSKDQSERIAKLAHLDLSDIKMKMPAPAQAPPKPAPPEIPPVVEEPEVQVSLPISFEAVMECQRRVKKSIGVLLPSSTFIARAAELANEELPRSKTAKPSADELFNAVLGLDKVTGKKYSRGNFIPQISGLSSAPKGRMPARAAKSDILDILSGKKPTHRPSKALGSADSAMAPVVSVSVPKGDERRGQVFLERFKSALELEPGRLVV